MKFIIIIVFVFISVGCNPLKKGVFELYDGESIVSVIYRQMDFQIEISKKDTTIAKINWISNKKFIIEGVEKTPNKIERLKFLVSHSKIEKNKFKVTVTPIDSTLDYNYQGILVKTNLNNKDGLKVILDSIILNSLTCPKTKSSPKPTTTRLGCNIKGIMSR